MADIIETPQDNIVLDRALRDNIIDNAVKQDRISINNAQLIRQIYEGVASDNINVVVDNTNRTISASILQNQYASRLEFPNIGSDKLLYIDLSDNSVWRFDTTNLVYICVGRDYTEINVINGGNA